MSSMFAGMTDSDMRNICKEKIESLEHWLRRFIDETLSKLDQDYFTKADDQGNRLVKKEISDKAVARQQSEPHRYPRKIDAILLDDVIRILCNPNLFGTHFKPAFINSFPLGNENLKHHLEKILTPRNNLAHANTISIRQAEQIICYSNDVIESLKDYYREIGMQQEYNAPTIIKIIDSFGNSLVRSQMNDTYGGGISKSYSTEPRFYLRPGDHLSIEIEVDPAFDETQYSISWSLILGMSQISDKKKIEINITNEHVATQFSLHCVIKSKKTWHRLIAGWDDYLAMHYKVLPPIE